MLRSENIKKKTVRIHYLAPVVGQDGIVCGVRWNITLNVMYNSTNVVYSVTNLETKILQQWRMKRKLEKKIYSIK